MKLLLLYGVFWLMLFFTSPSFFPPSNAAAIPLNRTTTSFSSSPSTTPIIKTTALVPGNCPCGRVIVVFDDDKEIIGVDRRICKDKNGSNFDSLMQLESAKFCYYDISLNTCASFTGKMVCGSSSGHYIEQHFNKLDHSFVAQSQNHSHELQVHSSLVLIKTACKIRSHLCQILFTKGIVHFVNGTWLDEKGNPFLFRGNAKIDFDNFIAHVSKLHNAYGVVLPRSVKNEIHFSQEVVQLGQLDPSTEPLTTTVSGSSSTTPTPSTPPPEQAPVLQYRCPVCKDCASSANQHLSSAAPGHSGENPKGSELDNKFWACFGILVVFLVLFVGISILYFEEKRAQKRDPQTIERQRMEIQRLQQELNQLRNSNGTENRQEDPSQLRAA